MDNRPLPWICLITAARSGTTHLVRMMDALQGLHVVRNEWLERSGVAWASPEHLKLFGSVIGKDITSHRDPDLNAWVRSNMGRTLELLQLDAANNARAAAIKLFENNLSEAEFDSLFFNKPETMFLFLKRKPVDSYISLRKAMALKKWTHADTTGLKVPLDPEAYRNWHQSRCEWFDMVETRLRGANRPFGFMSYEKDILPGTDHMLDRVITELGKAGFQTRRRHLYLLKLELRKRWTSLMGAEPHPDLGASKQDRASRPEDKVENWPAFVSAVESMPKGLRMLDSYEL